jgi:hypothetical protein
MIDFAMPRQFRLCPADCRPVLPYVRPSREFTGGPIMVFFAMMSGPVGLEPFTTCSNAADSIDAYADLPGRS